MSGLLASARKRAKGDKCYCCETKVGLLHIFQYGYYNLIERRIQVSFASLLFDAEILGISCSTYILIWLVTVIVVAFYFVVASWGESFYDFYIYYMKIKNAEDTQNEEEDEKEVR